MTRQRRTRAPRSFTWGALVVLGGLIAVAFATALASGHLVTGAHGAPDVVVAHSLASVGDHASAPVGHAAGDSGVACPACGDEEGAVAMACALAILLAALASVPRGRGPRVRVCRLVASTPPPTLLSVLPAPSLTALGISRT